MTHFIRRVPSLPLPFSLGDAAGDGGGGGGTEMGEKKEGNMEMHCRKKKERGGDESLSFPGAPSSVISILPLFPLKKWNDDDENACRISDAKSGKRCG